MKVPFSDISFDQEEIEAVSEVLKSGWPSRGKVSDEFEAGLSKYLGSNVALVNSGSSALLCALLAYGVKSGDTVLVPDFTFVATASIPAILGARIVPVDCDPETFNLEDDTVARTRDIDCDCLISTDVAGQPSNARIPIKPLIMDSSEAFGAEVRNSKIGGRDFLTVFSFNTTKALSTVEGGAVASKNEELIEKVRSIANYGRTKEQYVHDRLGLNCRITDMQSALGLIQLRKLDKNLARRKEIADRYRKELPQFQFQKIPSYVTKTTNFMMIALTKDRDFWLDKFQKAGIDARWTFYPIHMQRCFPNLPKCKNSWEVFAHAISLPIFNSMTDEQVDYVIEVGNN